MYKYIQGISEGKINILGGYSIGHSKQKRYMNMCPIPNGFRDRVIWMQTAKLLIRKRYYEYVLFLISVFIVQVTELVQFIINVRKFHRQHQCTLRLVWGHGVLFVWMCLASTRVTLEAFFYIPSNLSRKITATLYYKFNKIYRAIFSSIQHWNFLTDFSVLLQHTLKTIEWFEAKTRSCTT